MVSCSYVGNSSNQFSGGGRNWHGDLLRAAIRIADKYPPARARRYLWKFLVDTPRLGLVEGEIKCWLNNYFAERERLRREFLEGSGLSPDPDVAGCYRPGSWRLGTEEDGRGWHFVIHGVRDINGEAVSVRLTVKQFLSAGSVLRAIRKATGNEGRVNVTADEWRRVWEGFRYREAYGSRTWAAGLKSMLRKEMEEREEMQAVSVVADQSLSPNEEK